MLTLIVLILQDSDIDRCIEKFRSESVQERMEAQAQLVKIGSEALPRLQKCLNDSDQEVQDRARSTIREIRLLPGRELMSTKFRHYILLYPDNWPGSFKSAIEKNPEDPISKFVKAGRAAISDLIPLLEDMRESCHADWQTRGLQSEQVPVRVCDFALGLIQYHSLCRFLFNESSGRLFSQEPPETRREIQSRIEQWWAECRDKSVADGILAQIDRAGYYGKVWMAENLIGLGHKGEAVKILHAVIDEHNYQFVEIADLLMRHGDRYGIDAILARWKSGKNSGRIWSCSEGALLLKYGGKEEWQLLVGLAEERIAKEDFNSDTGAHSIVNAFVCVDEASRSPWAVPALALALRPIGGYDFREAAVGLLQKNTGKDFGFTLGGSKEDRDKSIRLALEWWEREGKSEYSFEKIEERLDDKQQD